MERRIPQGGLGKGLAPGLSPWTSLLAGFSSDRDDDLNVSQAVLAIAARRLRRTGCRTCGAGAVTNSASLRHGGRDMATHPKKQNPEYFRTRGFLF